MRNKKTQRKTLDTSGLSLPDIEKLAAEYADSQASLRTSEAEVHALTSKLDEELNAVRARYADELHRLSTRHDAMQTAANEKLAVLESWARAQRAVHFVTKKSLELARLVIGFSLNPHKVESLKGWTFTKAAAALSKTRWGKLFTKPDLDKSALLAARERLTPAKLASFGLAITQEEQFYVALKDETKSDALP